MDEEREEAFEYFNRDITLLAINILLEGYYRGQNVFTLDEFIKGDYWTIEEISEEIKDTGDYGSVEDLVLSQIIYIADSLNLGKIRRITITDISQLLAKTIKEAIQSNPNKNELDGAVEYYSGVIEEIYKIKKLSDEQIEQSVKKGKYERGAFDTLTLSENDFHKHLSFIAGISAPFIEFQISFIDERAKEIQKELEDYIQSFSYDDYAQEMPMYRDKRLYFSKQLENFYDYIKRMPVIDNCINIPFSALEEKGFEIIKILNYLELKKRIKVRNWNDTDLWNIKLSKVPITLESLANDTIPETKIEEKLKTDLYFDEAKSILQIGDNAVKLRKGSDQFHLLRIIFENKEELPKEWFYSEIAEKYDMGATFDDKKFYNASYQISQKIARDTPFRDVLITTSQSVQINPKYLAQA